MSATQAAKFAMEELLPKFPPLQTAILALEGSELVLGGAGGMLVWKSSVKAPCRKPATLALDVGPGIEPLAEVGDGNKPDYSSTIGALFPNNAGISTSKIQIFKHFLLDTQWDDTVATCGQFNEVEIHLQGGDDFQISQFLKSNPEQVTLPSMGLLSIKGAGWPFGLLFHFLNSRPQNPVMGGLKIVLHSSMLLGKCFFCTCSWFLTSLESNMTICAAIYLYLLQLSLYQKWILHSQSLISPDCGFCFCNMQSAKRNS